MGNCMTKNSVVPVNTAPEHSEIFYLMKVCTHNTRIAQIYTDYADDLESLINAIAENPSCWADSDGNLGGLYLRTLGVIGNEIGELFYPGLSHVLNEWYEHGEVSCPLDCNAKLCRGHYKTGYIVDLRFTLANPVCVPKITNKTVPDLDSIIRQKPQT
jgi:hypothetical protein